MKILIIEDTAPIANAYKKILTDSGYEVETSLNPLVGLSKALRNNYELIFVDLMMPELNGDELISRLRDEGVKTQIIITTNMASGYDEDELSKLGVKDIVLKSKVGPTELRELVARYT